MCFSLFLSVFYRFFSVFICFSGVFACMFLSFSGFMPGSM
jgi:hypothetical protein